MAVYYARASGNVNGTIWATTPTGTASNLFPSFTSSDILMSNNFTVTLNVNTTVAQVKNDNSNGATAGGVFNLNDGITLTADIFGGVAVNYSGSSSATIVGSITYGGSYAGVTKGGSGTLNVIGNIIGMGSGVWSLYISGGVTNITGNVTGAGALGANVGSPITVNITGNITAKAGLTGSTISFTNNLLNLNIFGSAITGDNTSIISYNQITTTTITRVVGNGFGNGSVGITSQVALTAPQNSPVRVYEIEYGALGQSPIAGPVFLIPATTNVALFYRSGTTKKTLVSADSSNGLLPNASDVRTGISYNAGNNIGTMAVPSASSVALGVAVDNTTGTAILTSDNIGDIWNYPVSGISVSNSIGERLKNCSTVASMGQQLAAALNNVQ